MRILCALPLYALALAGVVVPTAVRAGSVYQCEGPNGQIAFTNRPGTFSHCHAVANYADKKAAPAAHDAGKPQSAYLSEPALANTGAGMAAAAPAQADATGDLFQVHRGAVYKVVKANGITEYTNIRPRTGATYRVLFTYMATCYACNVHSSINWASTPLNLDAYSATIASAAREYGVDPALLRAVIHAESAFNRYAVSDMGAQGLMQLMPGTASDLGVGDPFDPAQNIRGGAAYLAALLKQFNGDERLATAAYNAGPQNVQKYNGVPPFDETRVYVQRVATLHKRYREASPPAVAAAAPVAAPKS
ncbi:MAG: lytic transglycosylase domain-containing protein [Rudaea sp.]